MSGQQQRPNWRDSARALSGRLGPRALDRGVRDFLKTSSSKRVLVACSGGADSVFLLCVLWAAAEELGLKIEVAHYNHRWRGAASDADARFVGEIATALSCDFICEARPDKEAAFTETTARALRLEFLRNAAAKARCRIIAYGHQQDDILETQLQRLARGSGTEGLAAPRPVHLFETHPAHIRPLIHLRAGDIRMAMNALNIPWQEDHSNADVEIARNALRHQIIPGMFDALSRDVVAGAARSRALLDEDAAALDHLARAQLPEAFAGADSLLRAAFKTVPRALARRGLVAWIGRRGRLDSASAAAVDQILDAVLSRKTTGRFSLGAEFLVFTGEQLYFEAEPEAADAQRMESSFIRAGETVILSQGGILESELVELDAALCDAILCGEVDVTREAYVSPKAGPTLEVRGWEPGDRFRPLGAPGSKKLKDWFTARRIPVKERKCLPIVLSGSHEVVWVPGFPPADSFKIKPSMKLALRLTYQNRNPL